MREDLKDPKKILDQEFSDQFVEMMRNRIIHGYLRYGPSEYNADKVDLLEAMRGRVKKYIETGNTEWIVDAANFLMLEFKFPKHEKAHFVAEDRKEGSEHPSDEYSFLTYRAHKLVPGPTISWMYRRCGD